MNSATPTRSYYPALDGLRGIAILLVICCHNLNFLPHFKLGWVGVDLFFVLSGFLITDILLVTKGSKNFLQNFYIRRILKIFPLYYGVLLLFFVIAPMLQGLQIQYHYYKTDQPMLWLHLNNWLSIIHIRPADSMLLNHFWSLSVEEQFYLLWPFFILAINNTRVLAQIAVLILVTCFLCRYSSWLMFGNGYTNFFFQYMTRMDGLCIGSLIAIWRMDSYAETKKRLTQLAVSVAGVSIVLFVLSKSLLPGMPVFPFIGYTVVAVLFGVIVFLAIWKRSLVSGFFLENKLIKYIGRISYGLYVYHWPVLCLFKIYLIDRLVNGGNTYYTSYAVVSLLALGVAVILSILSYHLFEKKMLALKEVMTSEGFFARAWRKLLLFFNPSSAR
ncbi:MAG: acyltransferase [Bacteroidetes bacterium]|jgi:peptidoglycan/LPS O-acetylase OafA/YrhL|nr:MAG: acyltransferase [Bacteroidota bacterium]